MILAMCYLLVIGSDGGKSVLVLSLSCV